MGMRPAVRLRGEVATLDRKTNSVEIPGKLVDLAAVNIRRNLDRQWLRHTVGDEARVRIVDRLGGFDKGGETVIQLRTDRYELCLHGVR